MFAIAVKGDPLNRRLKIALTLLETDFLSSVVNSAQLASWLHHKISRLYNTPPFSTVGETDKLDDYSP